MISAPSKGIKREEKGGENDFSSKYRNKERGGGMRE
jgi:hypothetical protein